MELAKEVRDFLEINSNENISYKKFHNKKSNNLEDLEKLAKNIYKKGVEPFYNSLGVGVSPLMYYFLLEPMKNGNFHSDEEEKGLELELFLSPKKILTSFNDGGSYFARYFVKEAWELKEHHYEKAKNSNKNLVTGVGRNLIFMLSDFIFVDHKERILYLGSKISNDNLFHL